MDVILKEKDTTRRSIEETVSDDYSSCSVLKVDSGCVVWRCWWKLDVFALRIERICWKMALFDRGQAVYLQINILSIEEYEESWVVESREFRFVGEICWQSVPMPTFSGDNFFADKPGKSDTTGQDRPYSEAELELGVERLYMIPSRGPFCSVVFFLSSFFPFLYSSAGDE